MEEEREPRLESLFEADLEVRSYNPAVRFQQSQTHRCRAKLLCPLVPAALWSMPNTLQQCSHTCCEAGHMKSGRKPPHEQQRPAALLSPVLGQLTDRHLLTAEKRCAFDCCCVTLCNTGPGAGSVGHV